MGRGCGMKKINSVKCNRVCQAKDKGGLAVRDVRLIHLSLLTKWRWRLLQGGDKLWKEVFYEKYGSSISDMWEDGSFH